MNDLHLKVTSWWWKWLSDNTSYLQLTLMVIFLNCLAFYKLNDYAVKWKRNRLKRWCPDKSTQNKKKQDGLKSPHFKHKGRVVLHHGSHKKKIPSVLSCVYANLFKNVAAFINQHTRFHQFMSKQVFTLISLIICIIIFLLYLGSNLRRVRPIEVKEKKERRSCQGGRCRDFRDLWQNRWESADNNGDGAINKSPLWEVARGLTAAD